MSELHFIELGDSSKQSIIIIHGLFGSHKNWNRISKQLADNYHVIAVDCRNHGDSFNHVDMDYPLLANDVWLLIEHLKLKDSIVLGHSMGGKIAMQLVSDHEDFFSQLVVVDIAPIAYQHNYADIILPILDVDVMRATSRKQVDEELKPTIKDDFIRQFLLQSLFQTNQYWYWKIDWQNLIDNMDSIVGAPKLKQEINLKSLFIFGEKSDYYKQVGLDSIKETFTQAEIEVVANANHWLHYEHADEFMAILKKYLP